MATVTPLLPLKSMSAFLSTVQPVRMELPLVHITKSEYVASIITEGALVPVDCPVFSEPLIYLFYGRPAYRIMTRSLASRALYCPVCFVFKPYREIEPLITRMFPFDSGAGKSGRFQAHIKHDTTEHYQLLPPNIRNAQCTISCFYDNNMNYFCGRAKSALTFQADEEIPARYYALVNDDGLDDYDDRRSCIEIQISKKISLKDALLTIVLPSTLLDDERVSVAIYQEWGTFPITYAIVHGTAPSQYTAVIRQRLLDFLSDTGYLK